MEKGKMLYFITFYFTIIKALYLPSLHVLSLASSVELSYGGGWQLAVNVSKNVFNMHFVGFEPEHRIFR